MTPHSCKELYDKIKDRPEYQRELELYDLEEAQESEGDTGES